MGKVKKTFKNLIEFGHLVRFSHTTFALPFALGSMWVAADGFEHLTLKMVLLILGCMITARNSAMAFNRLVDADIDARNPRTAMRHLPSHRMTKKRVAGFIIANGILFIAFAYGLNRLAFACALPVWLFLLSYSYWKRFSCLCHWFLGLADGLAPLGAWIAVRGEFAAFPIFLVFILTLWVGGFDIIYASQDEEVDCKEGLHSIPVKYGRRIALKIALASHLAMLALCVVFGFVWRMGWAWWTVTGLMTVAIVYIHLFRKSDSLDAMNRDFFLANAVVSFLVMIGLVVWILTGGSVNALS
ncbi:MAG: putative 4-hydroxybenzoate polyprenyltransferase [Fibrobacteraceae bacterium]|nr:putative 4-hydroxybenzoate polyprenyltransferase [Fibrobacteraceae bacterium]